MGMAEQLDAFANASSRSQQDIHHLRTRMEGELHELRQQSLYVHDPALDGYDQSYSHRSQGDSRESAGLSRQGSELGLTRQPSVLKSRVTPRARTRSSRRRPSRSRSRRLLCRRGGRRRWRRRRCRDTPPARSSKSRAGEAPLAQHRAGRSRRSEHQRSVKPGVMGDLAAGIKRRMRKSREVESPEAIKTKSEAGSSSKADKRTSVLPGAPRNAAQQSYEPEEMPEEVRLRRPARRSGWGKGSLGIAAGGRAGRWVRARWITGGWLSVGLVGAGRASTAPQRASGLACGGTPREGGAVACCACASDQEVCRAARRSRLRSPRRDSARQDRLGRQL